VSAYPEPASTPSSTTLVTTATSQPALRTGAVVLGLASLVDLSLARRGGGGADRMLAMSGAAAAGWFLVEGRRQR
jgi:hypothetical protein